MSVPPESVTPPTPGGQGPTALAQARARLAGMGGLSSAEQVGAFDEVHRLLQDALAAVGQPG